MVRISIMAADGNDSTSYYRCYGPLDHLGRTDGRFRFTTLRPGPGQQPNFTSFHDTDVLFIQRPHDPIALAWARAARRQGIGVVLDYDDDIMALPAGHPSYAGFVPMYPTVKELYDTASVIMTSTVGVADGIRKHTSTHIEVIPNAVNELWVKPTPPRDADRLSVVYRGGGSHFADLAMAEPVFTKPDVNMTYMGLLPYYMRAGRDKWCGWLEPLDYQAALGQTDASVLVVPLRDDAFNRARSNCSWLEATMAGLAVVHWTDKGQCRDGMLPEFADVEYILSHNEWLAGNDATVKDAYEVSMRYIEENLLLRRVNKARAEVLLSAT